MSIRVKRKISSAMILGPRFRCWRCQGKRLVLVDETGRLKPCPSCNGREPQAAMTARALFCEAADEVSDLRKAA